MQRWTRDKSVRPAVTVVEMLVATAMMAIIFTAILPLLASIRNSWGARRASAETIQNGRVLIDHIERNLSKAARITAVSPASQTSGYVQFQDADGNTFRYAVGADNYVEFGPVGSLSDLAGPVSQFSFTCYDGNDFSLPITDVNSIRFINIQTVLPTSALLGHSETFSTSVYLRAGTLDGLQVEEEFEPGVSVKTEVEWGGSGSVIDSYRSSQGAYNPASPGSEAIVTVNAIGSEKIVLYNNSIIRGDAYIGPGGSVSSGIKTWSGSQITGIRGTLDAVVDIPTLSAPTTPPFPASEGNKSLNGSATLTVSTNRHFNKLELYNSSKLIINGNVTIVCDDKVEVANYAEIEILTNSSLNLYAKKDVEVWNYAELNTSTADPSKLRIYIVGSGKDFETSGSTKTYAALQNPNGDVSLWGGAQLFGKIKAKSLEGGGKIHIDRDADFE